jgi:hypothetical protein
VITRKGKNNENVKIQQCEKAKTQQCKKVKIQECEKAKTQQCEKFKYNDAKSENTTDEIQIDDSFVVLSPFLFRNFAFPLYKSEKRKH